MPRPQKVDRPTDKTISLPTSLVLRVNLELFSEVEGKVPFGAWKDLIVRLLERHLQELEAARQSKEAS